MSSILKSLRKLESQKRGGTRAPDLLVDQGGGASPRSSALLPLAAGIALGALAVVLVLFLTMLREEPTSPPLTSSKPVTEQPATAAPAPLSSAVRDVRADLVSEQSPSAEPAPVTSPQFTGPVLPAVQADRQAPVALAPSEEPVSKGAAVTPRAQVARDTRPSVIGAKAQQVAAAVHTSVAEKESDLQVTEIFYQDDRFNSMAVVNDLPVMVGTQVESAVVKDILPDAVIFTLDDRTLTVPVSKP